MRKIKVPVTLIDALALPLMRVLAPLASTLSRLGHNAPRSRSILDQHDVAVIPHHYYSPVVFPEDLRHSPDEERQISGFDLNEERQLALLESFHFQEELLAIPVQQTTSRGFAYHNGSFESGDAEFLYDMIRHFKPRRIIEIGSGNSTLIAQLAVEKNRTENSEYRCEQICIEPFESPWLESIGVKVVRAKAETCPDHLFASLEAGDILFIDSSHVIRPQGDVIHEYLHLLGLLRPGAIVHVHDIFTPRDYPAKWISVERRMWNEQYLLEAFLSFNSCFEVIGAVNWLAHNHRERLSQACPILVREPDCEPGSFWFRRIR